MHDRSVKDVRGREPAVSIQTRARRARHVHSTISEQAFRDRAAGAPWSDLISVEDAACLAVELSDQRPESIWVMDEGPGLFAFAALQMLSLVELNADVCVWIREAEFQRASRLLDSSPTDATIQRWDSAAIEMSGENAPEMLLAKTSGSFHPVSMGRAALTAVAPRMRPGGRLLIHDCHPVLGYPCQRYEDSDNSAVPVLLQVVESVVANSDRLRIEYFSGQVDFATKSASANGGRGSLWLSIQDEADRGSGASRDPANTGVALFGDTYLEKHMGCALPLVKVMTAGGIAPVISATPTLPRGLQIDCLVFFNLPRASIPAEYEHLPRILIDHGASHLKWFLGSRQRLEFFDTVLTAGHDHVRSLESLFTGQAVLSNVQSSGFAKSDELLAPPWRSREEVCNVLDLDPNLPIVLFAPTWHKSANPDVLATIAAVVAIPNHVAAFHPETQHLPVDALRTSSDASLTTTELLKHADVVISDTSSTIYEAAALGKAVAQVLLAEYPDNPATLYDYPYTAGTSELFLGGVPCRPHELTSVVADLCSGTSPWTETLARCRERILRGTNISSDATISIANSIQAASKRGVVRLPSEETTSSQPPDYIDTRFFASHSVIAHGGGGFRGLQASNSMEAVTSSAKATGMVELDVCMAADGPIVAHDGLESRYGLAQPFREITRDEFLGSRFEQVLTPLALEAAIELASSLNSGLVIDIKPLHDAYVEVADAVFAAAHSQSWLGRTVIQCYCVQDFIRARSIGFRRVLLPVWKYYYRDPLGEEAMAFVEECLELDSDAVVGISIPYINRHMTVPSPEDPRHLRLLAHWKRVFVHGAPYDKYPQILRSRLGLFADRYSHEFEFKDLDEGFDWRTYLFLNPALIEQGIDNEVSAARHYLRWGKGEGRRIKYESPPGFDHMRYVDKNPALRRQGISGRDSALSHWTRVGSAEGLEPA